MPSIKALAKESDGLVNTVVMRAAFMTMHAHTEVVLQKGAILRDLVRKEETITDLQSGGKVAQERLSSEMGNGNSPKCHSGRITDAGFARPEKDRLVGEQGQRQGEAGKSCPDSAQLGRSGRSALNF
jgi:hypothetical protein